MSLEFYEAWLTLMASINVWKPAFWVFVLPEVDVHSNGGLSFTPGESSEGGLLANASLPHVVALSRGPSFREGQALPQYFFGHGQIFLNAFSFFFGKKWTKSIARRMSSTNVFESLSLIQNTSSQFQCNFFLQE